ncbi:hypothetical protein [Rhizobium sp. CNPSo 4039]|uniref:hypothetical protein n=1 Tax=Rhizobium sp. CNPSo 4039 TaxID=3021409 RepID=UPI00254A1F90|nr:hypothetical protein [Rhizobium sp. CNPSo 4039]MDK4715695.1 hypothetical protein [Rhizobium sp. CNPSo 4039]
MPSADFAEIGTIADIEGCFVSPALSKASRQAIWQLIDCYASFHFAPRHSASTIGTGLANHADLR